MTNPTITIDMQIQAVELILAKRHKLYPDFIEGALEQYQAMEAVLATLKGLKRQTGGLFDNATDEQVAEAIDR